jgi:type III pantothenate kinase
MGRYMSNYIIAADIGNTNTHIGLVNCASRTILSLDVFATKEAQRRCADSIVSLLHSMKHAMPIPVVMSCTVSSLEERLKEELPKSVEGTIHWVHYSPGLPLVLNYENTASFGPDRLANIIYGHEVYKGQAMIIIDAGTAVTIDYLRAGKEFLGGVILPGVSTQLASLQEHTAELPLVNIGEFGYEFPGLSTKACILNGVRIGVAGAISYLVGRYRQYFNEPSLVLCTGGSWKNVQDQVDFEFEFIPELTLVGCAFYHGMATSGLQK